MLDNLAASSIRPDYRRQLEMDTQDSEEDFFFRGSRRYPSRGAGAFSSAGQGSEHPFGVFSSATETRNSHQDPRRSGRAVPSLPSRSARSDGGILPSRARTKTVDGARSSPGEARRVRISAGRSPHRDVTDAEARAPEAVEEATTAIAMTI